MTSTSNPETRDPTADAGCPRFAGFSHVSLPVRDVAEACRFWTAVLGAEPVRNHHPDRFAEVSVGGIVLGFSRQPSGWTGRAAEFPHYAFFVNPADMETFKARLERAGVPTHAIWTRNRVEALMYFRDPSGNLFELYCKEGYPTDQLPVGKGAGGDYEVDLAALNYDWKG
ncbi:MAG TPA: VOC family protein [Chloroflexota bacterium]|nr:VOC family protein [Chloroflexota bacterium]